MPGVHVSEWTTVVGDASLNMLTAIAEGTPYAARRLSPASTTAIRLSPLCAVRRTMWTVEHRNYPRESPRSAATTSPEPTQRVPDGAVPRIDDEHR